MKPACDFLALGDGAYRLEIPDAGIAFTVDRLRRRYEELFGELTVTCDLPGAQRVDDTGVISAADLNLSSVRARQDRASLLAKRSQAETIDWFGAIESLCQRVIQAERTGAPSVLLRDVPKPLPDAAWVVHGLPILREQPEIVFGDGGSGKSILALSIAGELAQRDIPTLYCDWETSAADHRERLEQIFGLPMPAVHYVRAEWPLSHEVDRIRRVILSHNIQYVVLDSVAFGCSGPPESAEAAAEYFRAVRRLRVGTLLVAHITKGDNGDQRPFGSAFWHNGCRSTWFVKRSAADGDGGHMTVAMFNRKCNSGPLLSARGLQFAFQAGRIAISQADLADSEDFAAAIPTWQRMKSALRGGPLTLAALADEIDAKQDTLKKTIDRSKGRLFTRVSGADGVTRIALVERRSA